MNVVVKQDVSKPLVYPRLVSNSLGSIFLIPYLNADKGLLLSIGAKSTFDNNSLYKYITIDFPIQDFNGTLILSNS